MDKLFGPEVRETLKEKFHGCCECCGRPIRNGDGPHHKKYRSRQGNNSLENAAALCRRCHDQTHHPSSEEWKIATCVYRTPAFATEGQSELDFPYKFPYVERYKELRMWPMSQRS